MKLRLKKDFIIPKGTVFELLDHEIHLYRCNNLEAIVTMQDTTAGHIYLDPNIEDDRFEKV